MSIIKKASKRMEEMFAQVFGYAPLRQKILGHAIVAGRAYADWVDGDLAATMNHLSLMKMKYEDGNRMPYSQDIVNIVASKDVSKDLLQWLHDRGFRGTEFTINLAARRGRLRNIIWFRDHGYKIRSGAIDEAASNSHFAVVNWFHAHRYRGTMLAVDSAAINGHLDMMKFLHSCNYRGNSDLIDVIVKKGYLHIVEWLLDNGYEVTNDTVDFAVEYGHIPIVVFLHKRGYVCTEDAIHLAFGNVLMLRWLNAHGYH